VYGARVKRWIPAIVLAACGSSTEKPVSPSADAAGAPLSRAADAQMVAVPAGRYVAGSTPEERQLAYDDYQVTSGQEAAREHRWFEVEEDRHMTELPAFRIDLLPVTNAQYAEFVAATGAPAPTMDEATWTKLGLQQPWAEAKRFVWTDGEIPTGRAEHPVVLVDHDTAAAYCAWRGRLVGEPRRLPTAAEYEKAARGTEAFTYPWGNVWDATKLDSQVGGARDTVPVGSYAEGKSPYGVLELAGNVFEWTSTPWPRGAPASAPERMVKGSSWDDWAGVGRGASGHARNHTLRHVIIGFRCAADGAR